MFSIVPTSLFAEAHTRTTLKTEAVHRERTATSTAIIKGKDRQKMRREQWGSQLSACRRTTFKKLKQ
jgi:hypothetical protein